MLHLLKAEFGYHWRIFVGFAFTIPLFSIYAAFPLSETLSYESWMIYAIFMMLIYWYTYRNKERRDYAYATLPLSLLERALLRGLIMIIGVVVFIGLFLVLQMLLNARVEVNQVVMMKGLALVVTVFVIYFLVRDLLYDFFRRLGFNKQRVIFGALILTLGLNFLTVLSLMMIKNSGESYIPIRPVFDFIFSSQPFAGSRGPWLFLGFCSVSLAISVFSFTKRKSYLE
jgi:hypothetical protein